MKKNTIFKGSSNDHFLVIEVMAIDFINGHLGLYTNHEATFGFLYSLSRLQHRSEKH